MTDCDYCGKQIASDHPVKSDEGEPICHDCYVEHFTFTCSICSNFIYDGEKREEPKKYFVVTQEGFGVDPGLYKVKERPFYVDNYFSQKVRKGKVEKIASLTSQPLAGQGWCCNECVEKSFKQELPERHLIFVFSTEAEV